MFAKFNHKAIETMAANVQGATGPAAQDAFNQAALLVKGKAQASLQAGGKTGRIYVKRNPDRTHRASAPGEAPATDTGSLVSSINVDTKSPAAVKRVNKARAAAGSHLIYAEYLETGTANIAARPFMKPAFLEVSQILPNLLDHAIAKRLKLK